MGGVEETKHLSLRRTARLLWKPGISIATVPGGMCEEGGKEETQERDTTERLRACCFLATLERPFPTIYPFLFPSANHCFESVTRAGFSPFSYFPAAADSPGLTRQCELSVLTNLMISREANSQAENINMC